MEPRRYVKKSTLKYRRYILFVFFFFLLSYVPTGHSSSATSLLHERVSFEEQGGHLLLSIFVCVCVCFQCPPPHSTHVVFCSKDLLFIEAVQSALFSPPSSAPSPSHHLTFVQLLVYFQPICPRCSHRCETIQGLSSQNVSMNVVVDDQCLTTLMGEGGVNRKKEDGAMYPLLYSNNSI